MTDCRKCLFYDSQMDEEIRSGHDVIVDGEEVPDEHYCFTYNPMPEGYFEGDISCPKYLAKDE